MATTLAVHPLTVTVEAFGQTREVLVHEWVWTDPDRPNYRETRIDTQPVFAGRLRTGVKLWKVYAHLKPHPKTPGVYALSTTYTVILNRGGAIVGWWSEDRHEVVKSHHNSANQ